MITNLQNVTATATMVSTMDIYQILELILLTVTAIATSFYAYLTWKLAQPFISVMLEPDENDNLSMNLTIENVGSGTAYDVKFKVTPDFQIIKKRYLSQIGLFKNGLQVFSSHTKMKTHLTWMPADYENKIKNPLNIEVTYKNRIGWKYKQNFVIDFLIFGEVPLTSNPIAKIAKDIEKIESEFSMIIAHFDRIRVVAYTKEEDEQELKERFESFEKDKNS
jgi:hypothetical protein